jgi:hypothetical protein
MHGTLNVRHDILLQISGGAEYKETCTEALPTVATDDPKVKMFDEEYAANWHKWDWSGPHKQNENWLLAGHLWYESDDQMVFISDTDLFLFNKADVWLQEIGPEAIPPKGVDQAPAPHFKDHREPGQ